MRPAPAWPEPCSQLSRDQKCGDTARVWHCERSQECPHVRMTTITMLSVILMAVTVHGNTETVSQTSDSAMYNKILSSMDISREVRKVFTSLWATPEVKVSIEQYYWCADIDYNPGDYWRLRLFLGRGAPPRRGLHCRGLHQEELWARGRQEEDEESSVLITITLSSPRVWSRIISS